MLNVSLFKNNECMGGTCQMSQEDYEKEKELFAKSNLELRIISDKVYNSLLYDQRPRDDNGKIMKIVKHDISKPKEKYFRLKKSEVSNRELMKF